MNHSTYIVSEINIVWLGKKLIKFFDKTYVSFATIFIAP